MRYIIGLILIFLVACQPQPTPQPPTLPAATLPVLTRPAAAASPSALELPVARVWLEPPTATLSVNQTRTVAILIQDVQDLSGIEFTITYDPTLLEVLDNDPAQALAQIMLGDFIVPDFVAANQAAAGQIKVAFVQLPPRPSAAGQGQVGAFVIQAHAAGTAPLKLENVLLATPAGQPIPVQTSHSQVNIP